MFPTLTMVDQIEEVEENGNNYFERIKNGVHKRCIGLDEAEWENIKER